MASSRPPRSPSRRACAARAPATAAAVSSGGATRCSVSPGQVHHTPPARTTDSGRPRTLALPLGGRPVGGDLGGALVLGPAELAGEQAGDLAGGGGGGVPGPQPGAGAAGQHVVERGGHLVAGRVQGLDPPIGAARDQRLGQRRGSAATMASRTPGLAAVARPGGDQTPGPGPSPRRRAGGACGCGCVGHGEKGVVDRGRRRRRRPRPSPGRW